MWLLARCVAYIVLEILRLAQYSGDVNVEYARIGQVFGFWLTSSYSSLKLVDDGYHHCNFEIINF